MPAPTQSPVQGAFAEERDAPTQSPTECGLAEEKDAPTQSPTECGLAEEKDVPTQSTAQGAFVGAKPAPRLWQPFAPCDLARPAAADIVRVLATAAVGWFHLWQQTWVGGGRLDQWPRAGAVWVDALVLLSAFCLFLPYANAAAEGRAVPPCAPRDFYRRRAVRILPSYYVNLLFSFVLVVTAKGVSRALAVDTLAHLTLTQMFFPEAYTLASLNGVTWTLTIFALFYLAFPWLSRALVRFPVQVLTALLAVQAAYTLWLVPQYGTYHYVGRFNQLPALCGVFAAGFAAAWALAFLGRRAALRTKSARVCFSLLAIAALFALDRLMRLQASAREYQLHQLTWRMPLALAVGVLLVCMGLGVTLPFRRVWAFLSGISFNFYLWHQMLAVWMKYTLHLPAWNGETPPNQLGDAAWMKRANLLYWAVALAAAVLFTYAVEKPAARFLKKYFAKKAAARV